MRLQMDAEPDEKKLPDPAVNLCRGLATLNSDLRALNHLYCPRTRILYIFPVPSDSWCVRIAWWLIRFQSCGRADWNVGNFPWPIITLYI